MRQFNGPVSCQINREVGSYAGGVEACIFDASLQMCLPRNSLSIIGGISFFAAGEGAEF